MRVSQITISNFIGVSDALEIRPGGLTVLEGGNDQNKTTILSAIRAVCEGGHDATLKRNGAAAGEVVLVLEDGSSFRKRIDGADGKSPLSGKEADGTPMRKPKERLELLMDALSVTPLSFLSAPKDRRLGHLLKVVSADVPDADLSTAAGMAVSGGGLNGFEAISRIHDQIYKARTDTNREEKQKRATVTQLRSGLPSGDTDSIGVDSAAAYERLSGIDTRIAVMKSEANAAVAAAILEAETARDKEIAAARAECATAVAELQQQIDEIQKQVTAHMHETEQGNSAIKLVAEQKVAAIKQAAQSLYRSEMDTLAKERESALLETTRLDGLVKEHERAEANREVIARMEGEANTLKARADEASAALSRLDALREKLLGQMPIQGLEIRDGEIFVDAVAFDLLNKTKRIQFALKVARLRAKECKLICVDEMENLDPDNFALFEEGAKRLAAEGYQFVVAKVTRGPLQIQNVG